MNVALYLRKSRMDKDLGNDTLIHHEKALLELAKRNRYIIKHIYREIVSGETISDRPQMTQLLEYVGNGLYDAVLVMDMDRLGRGNMADQGLILATFQESQTKIVTPQKVYDLQNEADQEYGEFLAFFARRELSFIKKRLKRGKEQWVKEGNFPSSRAPYGYRVTKDGRNRSLIPEPKEAEIVKQIFHMYVKDQLGYINIAKHLNKSGVQFQNGSMWKPFTISGIIQNATYIGKVQFKKKKYTKSKDPRYNESITKRPQSEWIEAEGKHLPLISESLFVKAQEIRKGKYHTPVNGQAPAVNPLNGLIKCGECGRTMTSMRSANMVLRLRCRHFKYGCNNRSILLHHLEKMLLEKLDLWVSEQRRNVDEKHRKQPKKKDESTTHFLIREASKELQTFDDQLGKQYDLLERGVYDEGLFLSRSKIIKEKQKELSNHLAQLKERRKKEEEKEQIEHTLIPEIENVLDLYHATTSVDKKNELLKNILDHVIYERKGNNPVTLQIYPRI
ncbi:recombinase family protein [Thermoactinomyces sp. DSM 45892]|uniref:recombinase family protein n=1 Tax=Thermoactinomyces sp. DSM 45892 TaxID=1882753 RepID=UPI00089B48D7|nr:recombinase family protein [Thermoactinomyces sp. DSM 45892]SDY68685.1 Site-specific DNA recombinase [Thermoactinomyces sp. DSM 45892]